ncbi:hypothetical protein HYALB_00007763 [Hymenoscyphus albidus]|uniref:Uncharacterized protein n=1 Tax=Hymenoscyphus albidus TaxID=595503 RepID=A0A9N9Q838_9HELO|nr:hypothetical protein HYALB_00007763 [Hymenoscyphus albidus]
MRIREGQGSRLMAKVTTKREKRTHTDLLKFDCTDAEDEATLRRSKHQLAPLVFLLNPSESRHKPPSCSKGRSISRQNKDAAFAFHWSFPQPISRDPRVIECPISPEQHAEQKAITPVFTTRFTSGVTSPGIRNFLFKSHSNWSKANFSRLSFTTARLQQRIRQLGKSQLHSLSNHPAPTQLIISTTEPKSSSSLLKEQTGAEKKTICRRPTNFTPIEIQRRLGKTRHRQRIYNTSPSSSVLYADKDSDSDKGLTITTSATKRSTTHQRLIAINVINTLNLAISIIPKLKTTASECGTTPRLQMVVSDAHLIARFAELNEATLSENLDDELPLSSFFLYLMGTDNQRANLFVGSPPIRSSTPQPANSASQQLRIVTPERKHQVDHKFAIWHYSKVSTVLLRHNVAVASSLSKQSLLGYSWSNPCRYRQSTCGIY